MGLDDAPDRPTKEQLTEALAALADTAVSILGQLKAQDQIKAVYYEVQRFVLNDFDYTERGVQITSSGVAREQRPMWYPTQVELCSRLRQTPVFQKARELLSAAYPDRENPGWPLAKLIDRTVELALDAPEKAMNVGGIVDQLLGELDRRPIAHKAITELHDLVLLGCDFAFQSQGTNYRLRPTTRSDLERQHGHIMFGVPYRQGYPGAILEVSLRAPDHLPLQDAIVEALSVLSLFRPMSAGYYGYRVENAAVLASSSGTTIGGGRRRGSTPGRLYPDDDLEGFWQRVHPLVPQSLLPKPGESPNSLQIAYGRYLDALWASSVPQRVATAVMGLEALLSDGPGGSKYKLSVRTAKLLSHLGLPSLEVKSVLQDAYAVRSNFVHGKYFGKKDRDRLTNRAGDLERFIALLLDYLRLCLVAFLVTWPEGKKTLSLIDDALVDTAHDQELATLLGDAKPLCKRSTR